MSSFADDLDAASYMWPTETRLRVLLAAACAHAETRDGRVSARVIRQLLKDTRP